MTTCGMGASTKGQTKRKESRMQTESKIQGNNNASRRGQPISQRPEEHCLSQRRDNTASRRGGNTLSLAETGQQRKTNCCFHITGHGMPSNCFASVGRLHSNEENRDAFKLTRNSLDTFHPKRQALLHVSRLQTGSL